MSDLPPPDPDERVAPGASGETAGQVLGRWADRAYNGLTSSWRGEAEAGVPVWRRKITIVVGALIVIAVLIGNQGGGPPADTAAVVGAGSPSPAAPTPTVTVTPSPSPSATATPTPTPTRTRPAGVARGAQPATVSNIVDGDTIWVRVTRSGGPLAAGAEHKIRLLAYDSPEATSQTECGGPEATAALRQLVPLGATVYLEADEEDTDRSGRYLRYVHTADGRMVNLLMVRRGHGEAVLIQPNDAHIGEIRAAERSANNAGRGIWGPPCDIDRPAGDTRPGDGSDGGQAAEPEQAPQGGNCHPAYSPCVPPTPPDLDCGDLDGPIQVAPGRGDPHRLDGDGDGVGCESG